MADEKTPNPSESKVKLSVDKEKCILCGMCSAMYPNYFQLASDNSKIDDSQAIVNEDEVEEIIAVCPQEAIKKT